MLLNLKIRNFRSIREEINLPLTTERRIKKNDHNENIITYKKSDLLRSIIIYGRNASGKSNLLIAFSALKHLVQFSNTFSVDSELLPYEPFLFDEDYNDNPVKIEIMFVFNDIKYKYLIKYNKIEILYESLIFYPKNVAAKLFERKHLDISYGDHYSGNKKSLEIGLLKNQLFLSKSSSEKNEHLNNAYIFITNQININNIHDTAYDNILINSFAKSIINKKINKIDIINLLKTADTNIEDFSVTEHNSDKFQLPDNVPEERKKVILEDFKYDIKTKHNIFKNNKITGVFDLKITHESIGTKKLLAIGSQILETLAKGGVIIIDELDKSLHPLITKMLISLFHSPKHNPNNAQLIFATHDSSLLDGELFRRDQICFVDKEYEGNTILYRLSDFKGVRNNIPIDKWYLSGRFKAIPVMNTLD